MKIIDIVGDNYSGNWTNTRTACRGIVIEKDKILLSYETLTDQWMIPGGGLEENESEYECCRREISEETGLLIRVSPCILQINEFYEDWKYVSRYFLGTCIGRTETKLTEREKLVAMEARWLPLDEALDVFSHHASYADTDEMRRGMYLREYTALRELFSMKVQG